MGSKTTKYNFHIDPSTKLLYMMDRDGCSRLCISEKAYKWFFQYAYDPKATFASAEVTEAVTTVDDLYQKGLDKFNKIEAKLDYVRL